MVDPTPANGRSAASNWAVIIAGSSFGLTMLSGAWQLANPRGDLTAMEGRMQMQLDAIRKDVRDRQTLATYDEFEKTLNIRLGAIEDELKLTRGTVVRRIEMEGRLGALSDRILPIREGLMEIQRQFTGSYNVGKVIDDINTHLRLLDQRIDQKISNPSLPK